MIDERWLFAAVAVGGGILLGAVAGWRTRRFLASESRPDEVRKVSKPLAAFVFWFLTSLGIVVGVGAVSPESLEPLPGQILSYLPRVLVAGLILIGGHALSSLVAVTVSRSLSRASGGRHMQIRRVVQYSLMGAAIILAMNQLGVDTTILTLSIAAALFTAGTSIALLVGIGGRQVAGEVAAGRYIRRVLKVGDAVNAGGVQGVVLSLHPASLELETETSARLQLPYSHLLTEGFQYQSPGPKEAP
jgi:hypothetical protein